MDDAILKFLELQLQRETAMIFRATVRECTKAVHSLKENVRSTKYRVVANPRKFYSSWHVQPRLAERGGKVDAYAILSWLSVNASLSYLLRGQLR